MSHQPYSSAISQVLKGEFDHAIPVVEMAAINHPEWVTPVVVLATAAERTHDWESAYELWSQARILLPDSVKISRGVRKASLMLLKEAMPEKRALRPDVSDPGQNAPEPIAGEPATSREMESADSSEGPTPLVAPLEFDLTEFATDESFVIPADPAPAAQNVPSSDAATALDDLDELIGRLEGARIVPRNDADEIPAPNLEADIDDVASETLATIYLSQSQFTEAARVFERLAEMQPEREEEFLEKAHEARARESD